MLKLILAIGGALIVFTMIITLIICRCKLNSRRNQLKERRSRSRSTDGHRMSRQRRRRRVAHDAIGQYEETVFGAVGDRHAELRGNYRSLVINPYEYADLYLPGDVHADLHNDEVSLSYEDVRVPSDFPSVVLHSQCPAKNLRYHVDEPVPSTSYDTHDMQPCYLQILSNEKYHSNN